MLACTHRLEHVEYEGRVRESVSVLCNEHIVSWRIRESGKDNNETLECT